MTCVVYIVLSGCACYCLRHISSRNLGDNIPTGNDNAADRTNIESKEAMKVTTVTSVLDRIRFNGAHWHGRAVEFRDVTDWNNNLVSEQDFISYRRTPHRGNILIVSDGTGSRGGVVMLKGSSIVIFAAILYQCRLFL